MQAASRAHGLEGVVGKPLASAYHPGQRRDWIKVKNTRHAEVIIGGWKPGQGRRAGTIGSLLLGVPDRGQLRYAGHVGTGFTAAMLTDLARQAVLGRLARRITNDEAEHLAGALGRLAPTAGDLECSSSWAIQPSFSLLAAARRNSTLQEWLDYLASPSPPSS